ncbi:MAG TPA: right-handed parallel beta-helix repeat-containing protein [Gemmataceae bacterium]|nr:right-handed parallel beta-helix repeat-containing protein [Gemmataceae bacterium]
MRLDWITKTVRPTRRTAARLSRRSALRVDGMEDRTVPATFNVAAGGSIQAAIDAAAATNDGNDIINIAPATYTGNLVIPNSANLTNLLIQKTPNSTGNSTIKASSAGAILTVDGETGVTINSLVFDGSNTPANQGIFIKNGGQATIQSNVIQNINPSSGEGIGIRVGRSAFAVGGPTTGTATVSGNVVTGYGDAGIVIANVGSSGTVSSNTVTGLGAPAKTDQNGIEISYGASGTVSGNAVSANGKKNGNFVSVGIFLYKAASGVQIIGNAVSNNNFGISVMDGTSPVIQNNSISGSTYYGIGFDSSDGGTTVTMGATVTNNSSSNSAGGTVADGFDIWYLHSSAANPVSITKNNASSNTGDGFNFFLSAADTAGTWIMSANGNANGNGGNGYHIQNSSGLSVNGMDGSTNGNANGNGANGFLIESCQNITVSNYNANSNGANGIYVTGSTGVTITNNQAAQNSLNGFLFENSSGLTISNNFSGNPTGNKASNGLNGFSFVNTGGSSVTGNTAQRNGSNGILLDANSTGNTLSGNTLTLNNKGNNGSFDANDLSGTPTTVLNSWSNNTIGTKNKSVIS